MIWCDYDALNQALIRLSRSAVHCYAMLSSVTHWKLSRSPISCRFWSRAYIKMQQIHNIHIIIASLTPEQDGRRTRSRSSRCTRAWSIWRWHDVVSLLYNYILALEAEESGEEQQRQGEVDLPAGGRRPFIRSCSHVQDTSETMQWEVKSQRYL